MEFHRDLFWHVLYVDYVHSTTWTSKSLEGEGRLAKSVRDPRGAKLVLKKKSKAGSKEPSLFSVKLKSQTSDV